MNPNAEAAVRACWAANADTIRSFVSAAPHWYHTVWLTPREMTDEEKAVRLVTMDAHQISFNAEWDDSRKMHVVCADVVLE